MSKQEDNKKGLGISGIRRIVQVCMLLLFVVPVLVAGWLPLGFTEGGSEVNTPSQFIFYGTLSASSVGPINIVDPFAALQFLCSAKTLATATIIGAIIPLVVYGLISGRVFCGWVCPVNLFMEFIDWLRKKLKLEVQETVLPRHTKVWVALGILVLSAIFSVPVFEYFSPISTINKLLAFGSLAGLVTLIAIIIVELFWGHRVWCRSICPLGGFYEVLGKVGLVRVQLQHDACIHCNKCKTACLCDPEILQPALDAKDTIVRAGDCMICGKCVDVCPTKALSIGIGRGSKLTVADEQNTQDSNQEENTPEQG